MLTAIKLIQQNRDTLCRAFLTQENPCITQFREFQNLQADSRNQIEVRALRSVMNDVVSDTAKLLSAMRNRI